jgi:hypothetical protein
MRISGVTTLRKTRPEREVGLPYGTSADAGARIEGTRQANGPPRGVTPLAWQLRSLHDGRGTT